MISKKSSPLKPLWKNLFFSIVFYFLLILLEAATAMFDGLKENYICIVPL
jgi:hypothetical protein